MVTVIRHESTIENIYTYFEFLSYDDWEDCDEIFTILTEQLACELLEKLEGIYSKHYTMNKNGFVFKLMYHEDVGNCLCNQKNMDSIYYDELEKIANLVAEILPNKMDAHQ